MSDKSEIINKYKSEIESLSIPSDKSSDALQREILEKQIGRKVSDGEWRDVCESFWKMQSSK